MIAKLAPRALALLVAVVVVTTATQALAYCSSCSGGAPAAYSAGYAAPVAYSAGYAAPVAYTAAYAAPVAYTTAYAPAYTTYNSGWYPGRFFDRRRSVWGYPTTASYAPTYTAAYAPTYTAAYAPVYTAAYAPAVSYASYTPACSTCSASYAPACSTCTASYAPVCDTCSTCSTCDACAASGTTCASCAAGSVSQATYIETPTTTVVPQTSSSVTTSSEPQPTLAPTDNPPATRIQQEAQKPAAAEAPLQPEPRSDSTTNSTDETTSNIQAPQLFDPNDRTATLEKPHRAPVWTAVYHKTSGAEAKTQTVAWPPQVEADAAGWSSASK